MPCMGTTKEYIYELSIFNTLLGTEGWILHPISIKVGPAVAARVLKHDQLAIFKIHPCSMGRPLRNHTSISRHQAFRIV